MISEDERSTRRQEYSLTVGQFAKLCLTTRDTLRHYYELGILTPWADPSNGYHYYSASQISSSLKSRPENTLLMYFSVRESCAVSRYRSSVKR